MSKNEKIMRLLGLKYTVSILEYMDTHKEAHYKDMLEEIAGHVLNSRLKALQDQGLIEHHFERKEKRREWYTITEKGKKALYHIRKLQNL